MSLALVAVCGTVMADTIYLTTGVQFDGVVTERPDGLLDVKAGDETLIYRKDEVLKIEKNTRTGHLDLNEELAKVQAELAEMEKKTGLTAEQRDRINELIASLSLEPSVRMTARDKLIALQSEMDVFRYLDYLLPSAGHFRAPYILEAMWYINRERALPIIERNVQNNYFGMRERAISLLGEYARQDSIPLIVRGLADDKLEVRIAAAYALAKCNARQATPALIDSLRHPDLRVASASKEALEAIWASETAASGTPKSADEWSEFWGIHGATIGTRFRLAELQPLVTAEEEFQNE
jgi:hypothetical protein